MDSILDFKLINFNVALINTCTEVEGPFKRMAIWFQGCNIKCKYCCNPRLQKIEPANIVPLHSIIDIARESKKNNQIEGVTLLGGEPTLQTHLIYLVRELKKLDLGTILFTGKLLNELDTKLTGLVDMVIDGKYDFKDVDEERNLIGSRNQNIYMLTNRYINQSKWFEVKRDYITEINVVENLIITGDPILK